MSQNLKLVPNEFPKLTNQPYKIAFIGEAPGESEERQGRPFVGPSGVLLWAVASKHGIVRDACFVGNVCQQRPPGNKIDSFAWDGPEIQMGLAQLKDDLCNFSPNLIVLLGNAPLKAFAGESGITLWRGSLLKSTSGQKLLPTLHPAGILREYSGKALLDFDLKRARVEGLSPILDLPQRNLRSDLTFDEIIQQLQRIHEYKPTVSTDIEGYWDHIWAISFAESPSLSFTIPCDGWSFSEEKLLWLWLARVLTDPQIPKILQNSLYDTFCLQYGYSIPVLGVVDDTMLQHWEMFCELPKRLSFLASIYTREPYWKDERDDEDRHTRLLYCAKDSAVTYEVRDVIKPHLRGTINEHYLFNLQVLKPLRFMEQKGINYDKEKANQKAKEVQRKIYRLQYTLDRIAGYPSVTSVSGWVDILRDTVCFKRSHAFINLLQDILPHALLSKVQKASQAVSILKSSVGLDYAAQGELETLTETNYLNVESKDQIADFLYRQLGLPVQFKKEHGRKTEKETTDVLALLTLFKKTEDPTLRLILSIRSLRTRLESLCTSTDPDGRIRCGYNVVGSKTGRLSCYQSPTGSGFNLQTATKKDRDLFLPDPGYWMFQCDLSGADSWTVAAHSWSLGDPTMLDDLQSGIKPHKIVALLHMHGREVLGWTRDKIKSESKGIDQDGWLYFACKRVVHGSSYGMKKQTMCDQILKDSYKLYGEAIYVEPNTCELLRQYFFIRYPGIISWQDRIRTQIKQYGYLDSANGHRRQFFGRRSDHKTFTDALADEPQNNTTYACNRALLKLWTDPSNQVDWSVQHRNQSAAQTLGAKPRSSLRIQPLHQVHDALIGQFRKEETEWSIPRIRAAFDNKMTIARMEITIPFEGAYGESWGKLKEGVI